MLNIFGFLGILNGWRTLIFCAISMLSVAMGLLGVQLPFEGRELYGNLIISLLASGAAGYFRLVATQFHGAKTEVEQ